MQPTFQLRRSKAEVQKWPYRDGFQHVEVGNVGPGRSTAGKRISTLLTSNFPTGQRKPALNRHFQALLDRR